MNRLNDFRTNLLARLQAEPLPEPGPDREVM